MFDFDLDSRDIGLPTMLGLAVVIGIVLVCSAVVAGADRLRNFRQGA